jgi:hypothetical protein
MAWSVLQSCGNNVSSGNGTAGTGGTNNWTANLSSGSKLVALVQVSVTTGGTDPVSSVKDANGNSFGLLKSYGVQPNMWSELWVLDTPAGDVGTQPLITATIGPTNFGVTLVILEVTGLQVGQTTAILDGTPGLSEATSGTSPAVSGSYSSTAANELLLFLIGDDGNNVTIGTPTGSTTYSAAAGNIQASNFADGCIFYGNSTNGAESASSTLSASDDYQTILVAINLAASAPTGPAASPGRQLPNFPVYQVFSAGRMGAGHSF